MEVHVKLMKFQINYRNANDEQVFRDNLEEKWDI